MKELKMVILGSGGVGKTWLVLQFVSGVVVERYDPTIEDFHRKEVDINGEPVIIMLTVEGQVMLL